MLYATKGEGELQKNQGEYTELNFYDEEPEGGDGDGDGEGGSGEGSSDGITLTKKELSNKITNGRDEGIEKGRRDALNTINDALGTDFGDLETAKESLAEEAHVGDIEESDVVQDLQGKLKERDQIIQAKDQKIQDLRVKDTLMSDVKEQLGDKDLKLGVDDIKTLHDKERGYTEKDGELYATKNGERLLNDSGEFMKYSESIMKFAENKNLIEGSASGGSGGSTTPSGSGSGSNENPFETGNLTEQARLKSENPEKYKRLKARANS